MNQEKNLSLDLLKLIKVRLKLIDEPPFFVKQVMLHKTYFCEIAGVSNSEIDNEGILILSLYLQMNKLQRELETELSKLRDARGSLERKLDEAETDHKKQITQLKDEKEEMIDNLRKEKVGAYFTQPVKINLASLTE